MNMTIKRTFPESTTECTVKYPKQIFSAIKKKGDVSTTFAVDANLVAVDDADGITPGELHKQGLSRFTFSILNVEKGVGTNVSGNIPIAEIASFLHEAHFSLNYLSELKLQPQATTVNAGTTTSSVTLKFGPFKGKTPAEVLTENPANKDSLENTKKLLLDKVAQYPANQELIDAIDNAINALNSGSLEVPSAAPTAPVSSVVSVFDSGIKVPNSSKKNENGKTLVYTVKVNCNPNMKIPYEVEIMNGYCLVPKDGEVDFKSMENNVTLKMRLSKAQMCTLVANIERRLTIFEQLHAEKVEFLENKYSYFKQDLSKNYEIDEKTLEALAVKIAEKLK